MLLFYPRPCFRNWVSLFWRHRFRDKFVRLLSTNSVHAYCRYPFVLDSIFNSMCVWFILFSGAWDPTLASEQTISEAVAEDLPPCLRASLKHLAHEVAGAVVLDLGKKVIPYYLSCRYCTCKEPIYLFRQVFHPRKRCLFVNYLLILLNLNFAYRIGSYKLDFYNGQDRCACRPHTPTIA